MPMQQAAAVMDPVSGGMMSQNFGQSYPNAQNPAMLQGMQAQGPQAQATGFMPQQAQQAQAPFNPASRWVTFFFVIWLFLLVVTVYARV